jgi:hypothetical protein
VDQTISEQRSASVKSGFERTDGDFEDVGGFVVGEFLNVAKLYRQAVLGRKVVELVPTRDSTPM